MSRSSGSQRILIVDDDAAVLHAVTRILDRRYAVIAVENGEAALANATHYLPDLAIVDIRMPGINGFEVTRRLKELDPSPDVILMTGDAEEPDETLLKAIDEGAFYFIQKPFDRRVLLALVARCLELRRLRQAERLYIARLEREMEEARQFQVSLLPPCQQELLGVSINARYLACSELAGDIYDYIQAGADSVALLVADVVGHGASAAMMTSVVKSAFHAAADQEFDPLKVIGQVKQGLRTFDEGRFVTLACARLNTTTRDLVYVNAGHPPLILRKPGCSPRLLTPTGPILSSAFYDVPHEIKTVRIHPDDSLLMFTDGVTETFGDEGPFGEQRILSLIEDTAHKGADLLDHILETLANFAGPRRQQDDITLLALDLCG